MANSKDPDDMAPQTLGASTVGRKKLFEDIMEPIRLNTCLSHLSYWLHLMLGKNYFTHMVSFKVF